MAKLVWAPDEQILFCLWVVSHCNLCTDFYVFTLCLDRPYESKSILLCVCVYTHVHVYVCVYMYVCTCMHAQTDVTVFLYRNPPYVLRQGLALKQRCSLAGWTMNSSNLPVFPPHSPNTRIKDLDCYTLLSFYYYYY